ncbi:MAG: Gfo/Idh/MocA family oxidoreductase [Methylobacterium sp.]|nr:Gfo/Idh/MocA family oxidoreductase [Methylobacterium sp.]
MKTLAIAGLGRWGKVLVDSVQGKSDKVRFGVAVTRDPAAAQAYCSPKGIRPISSLEAALADPAIDGIVLATPHSRHGDEVIACARAGKAVFVEKPFTLTRETAERALDAASKAGIIVAAGHNRRWLAPIMELKRMIEAGELGTILHIETNFSGNAVGRYTKEAWRVAPGESPAGGLAGSGIHQIDAVIHLVAPITEVYAVSVARIHDVPLDDTTVITFRLADGATASLLTMTATAATYRLQIFGTKAKVQIDGAAEKRGSETMEITSVSGERSVRQYAPADIERAELEAFADAISGKAPYPIRFAEILNGIAAFEAVSISAASGLPVKIAPG